ncbi:hypothetical protein C8J56DRAFT_1059721 [Mycena floridula]|nr:hypothetical protein C8J56DRAFT_1059721 [Mycena floridula]
MFQVLWKSGDETWLPYDRLEAKHALPEYLEALGVDEIEKLRDGRQVPPEEFALEFGGMEIEGFITQEVSSLEGKTPQLQLLPRYLEFIAIMSLLRSHGEYVCRFSVNKKGTFILFLNGNWAFAKEGEEGSNYTLSALEVYHCYKLHEVSGAEGKGAVVTAMPMSYVMFTEAFNSQPGVPRCFRTYNDSTRIITLVGPEPPVRLNDLFPKGHPLLDFPKYAQLFQKPPSAQLPSILQLPGVGAADQSMIAALVVNKAENAVRREARITGIINERVSKRKAKELEDSDDELTMVVTKSSTGDKPKKKHARTPDKKGKGKAKKVVVEPVEDVEMNGDSDEDAEGDDDNAK